MGLGTVASLLRSLGGGLQHVYVEPDTLIRELVAKLSYDLEPFHEVSAGH